MIHVTSYNYSEQEYDERFLPSAIISTAFFTRFSRVSCFLAPFNPPNILFLVGIGKLIKNLSHFCKYPLRLAYDRITIKKRGQLSASEKQYKTGKGDTIQIPTLF